MAQISRVCLIGPESTGKSRLAERLARHFGATWLPEHAREYAEQRENKLTAGDVEAIARGHMDSEARNARAGVLLILDTDLISTVVYARHYYGRVPEWIVEEARRRRADLYLLMDTDVPWIADAARDSGGEGREDLFDSFLRALDEFECEWVIISGDWEERFRSGVAAISGDRQPATGNEP